MLAHESDPAHAPEQTHAPAPHPTSEPVAPKPPATPGYESPGRPRWEIGQHHAVVPRDDPAWDRLGTLADNPNARLCRDRRDGSYIIMMTLHPEDPNDPYPADDRNRPC